MNTLAPAYLGRFLGVCPRACLAVSLLVAGASVAYGQGYSLWTFTGTGGLGFSVAGAGDVDADGFDDIVVGAPLANPGGLTWAGQATVFSGATGNRLFTLAGSAASQWLGHSVAGAGDVNGDGLDDVVVGVPWANVGGIPRAGEAKVLSGATGGLLWTFTGSLAADELGFSVAGAGDVDGDGFDDVVAGAPMPNPITVLPGPGRAKVFSGVTGATLFTFVGPSQGAWMGHSVAGAGDVDGDGFDDVVVGALGVSPGGEARVFSGATGALVWSFSASSQYDFFGYSVAGAGDVDGDGLSDVVVGAPAARPYGLTEAGQATVFSGASGAILSTFNGFAHAHRLGWSVAGPGDVDGDGLDDVFVGAPGAFAFSGQAILFSRPARLGFFAVVGATPSWTLGQSVGRAGDVNGDGMPDLVVGSQSAGAPSPPQGGEAKVISIVGIPPGSNAYGAGCAGTGGFVPRISTFGGVPSAGNAGFGFAVSRGLGGAPAFLFLGTAPNVPGMSIGGCNVHLSGLFFLLGRPVVFGGPAGAGGAGYRLVEVGVPADPGLVGAILHFQWAVVDGGSPNGLFTTSDALAVRIQ